VTALTHGVGLFIGETAVCVARHSEHGYVSTSVQPAVMSVVAQEVLDGTRWAERGARYAGKTVLFGDEAIQAAEIGPVRANLKSCGRLDVHTPDAEFALARILDATLQEAEIPAQYCVYSVPSPPIDISRDHLFQAIVLKDMIRKLGYSPYPLNEARAIPLGTDEQLNENLLLLLCDERRIQFYLSYHGLIGIGFCAEPGGRRVDEQVAHSLSIALEKARRIRRECQNLIIPQGREEEAVVTFCNLFANTIIQHINVFFDQHGAPVVIDPIEIIWAGAWRPPEGFDSLLRRQAERSELPLPLGAMRFLTEPEITVARGCLKAASILDESQPSELSVDNP
jgi:hypothetical protein